MSVFCIRFLVDGVVKIGNANPTEKGKTMREKLIELLECTYGQVKDRDYDCYGECKTCQAENLIANGVGFLPKWIPVTERLPDTAERVLVCKTWLGRVYKPEYGYYQDFPNRKGCWYVLTEFGYYPQREVTHWMPMPEPPSEERI